MPDGTMDLTTPIPDTATGDHSKSERRSRGLDVWLTRQRVPYVGLLAMVLAIAGFLAFYNLESYPRTWFDEGSHLHVPKNLVQYGVYADISSEGFRYDGPTLGIGPTVFVPIAVAFKVLGIGLLQARLVMVAFSLLTLLVFWSVARHLYGRWVALLSTALLLGSPGVGFVEYGRQVLGEVPALGFYLLGTLLVFAAWDRTSRRLIVAGGFVLGLAMITKNHYAVIVPAAVALLVLADRLRARQVRLSDMVILVTVALVVFGTWYGYQTVFLGSPDVLANLERLRASSSGAVFVFAPKMILPSAKSLFRPEVFFGWMVPGLVYATVLAMSPRHAIDTKKAFVVSFVVTWLCWYVFASVGWARYAFAGLALSAIFAAKLIVDLVGRVSIWGHGALPKDASGTHRLQSVAVCLLALVVVFYPLWETAKSVKAGTDETPQEFARVLDSLVPRGAVIETWEPELGFLTDQNFHYPPMAVLDKSVRKTWLDSSTTVAYDPNPARPAYLALGVMGKWTGIYHDLIAAEGTSRIATVGEYDLYKLVPKSQ